MCFSFKAKLYDTSMHIDTLKDYIQLLWFSSYLFLELQDFQFQNIGHRVLLGNYLTC